MDKNYKRKITSLFSRILGVIVLMWCTVFIANAYTIDYQSTSVSGTVTDETGDPLPGVNVMVKGTATGVTTGLDGSYTLNPGSGDVTLVFSFIGYLAQEIALNNRTRVDVSMAPDVKQLSEVVIIGYGQQEKRDVTASISSLDEESIKSIPVASAVEAMQGQVSGVDIVSNGGRPGQAPQILIRGRRSISAGNDPLFVVDGVPQATGSSSIVDINPQDIVSMEILKDAAATAIYGSRGANGVILVTTKRGAEGKTQLNYSSYFGVTNPIVRVDMMNGEEFAAMKRESRRSSWDGTIPADADVFDDPIELESLDLGRSTDYQDLVLGSGSQSNHQISVLGGDSKTQFNIAMGYFKENGIIEGMDYTRINGRVNLDHQINDIFKAGISFTASSSVNNWGSNAVMGEALSNNPLGVPYDENGEVKFLPTNDGIRTNPLSELVPGAYEDERKAFRILLPVYLEAKIMDGLTFKTQFSPDVRYYRRGEFRGSLTNDNRGGPGDAEIQNNLNASYTLENFLTYNKEINSRNSLTLTALQSIQSNRNENYYTAVQNLPFETGSFYAMDYAEVKGNIDSDLEEWRLSSYMGRVTYDFDGKYLIQASIRADGSSVLGSDATRWSYFPGVSIGWRVIDEDFMSNVEFLNELKVRSSYGEVGNQAVGSYQTLGKLGRSVYAWGDDAAFGFALLDIPNRNLGWEISKTLDFGVDYGFMEGRFSGSIDYYITNTTDLLLNRALPPTSGYSNVYQNIGSTKSTGIEFNLGANVLTNENGLNWDVSFNITHFTEEITELALKDADGNPIDDVGNGWFIGSPIEVFYDYEKTGIWQSNEVDQANTMENKVPGEIKLKDQNGNGVIDPEDRIILGSDVPDYYGGITNRLSYQGFDLSIFFIYRQGHMIRSRFHDSNNSLFARYNNLDVDYWTIDNPTNEYPRPNENQESPVNGSTLSYFDGSYVKLRNITLGYNLPSAVTDKLKMSSARVYLSAQNPKFWAKYESFDPETPGQVSSSVVPSTRLFMGGINVTF